VQISGGSFNGLQAVVSRVMPSRQRVLVLLDFLGRQTSVQVGLDTLVRDKELYKRTTLVKPLSPKENE
jgi:transcription antitermination factor NusG